MILYFSGTGNTHHIALRLAHLTGDEAVCFSHCESLPGDVLGLVFPIYAWDMPRVFKVALQRLLPRCSATYIYMVCTCGDDIGTAHRLLDKRLRRHGLRLDAALSVQMPETYVALPGFRLDAPGAARRKWEQAELRIRQAAPRLQRRERFTDVVPGAAAWCKSHVLNPLFYRFFVGDRAFRSLDGCNGCGTCARSCPVGNITLRQGRPRWNGRCTGCLACYHHCPQDAVQLGRRTREKGRYRIETYRAEALAADGLKHPAADDQDKLEW